MDNTTLHLIDGSGYIFRAYHALPPLSRSDGTPVGAVYGFCTMMLRLLERINHDKVLVVFDAGKQTFRQDIYPNYKANRPPAPEDLIPQFAIIRESCQALGVPYVEQSGFEADDLIASYAYQAHIEGFQVSIISSDKDLMQLINPSITMFDPIKNKKITAIEVEEKFGVSPSQVIDVQALAGDSSDNIPGVPSIGIKTAAELIRTYGNLETLLQNLHTIKQQKRRESLQQNIELAQISKKLVTLIHDLKLPLGFDDLHVSTNVEKRTDFFKAQGFNSLASKTQNSPSTNQNQITQKNKYICVQNENLLQQVIKDIYTARIIAVDTETTGLDPRQNELVGISVAFELDKIIHSYYIPIRHQTNAPQLEASYVLNALKPILEHPGILKIGHNIKFDRAVLHQQGIEITPFDDTMLLSYTLDAGKNNHNLDELTLIHLDHKTIPFKEVAGTGQKQKTFDEVDLETATNYAAEDAYVTLQLYKKLNDRINSERLNTFYQTIEKPLVPVIEKMERTGIIVSASTLHELSQNFESRIRDLEQAIYIDAKGEFNIGSPKQLGEVLFERLSLPDPKRTKTGAYVTDGDTLEKLSLLGHEIPAKVLEWRSLSKLKSTYIEGLLLAINPKTGRVHTSYNLAGTSTGRISSSDPNLQNIPIRTEDGRHIRKAFIAENGYTLVSLDYSQIELRLLAHMADVQSLQQAFSAGEDIHRATASAIFNIPIHEVSNDYRRKAKAINFGIIYGISPFGLSQQLNISTSEAATIIRAYFDRYPGIQAYMEKMKNIARERGYVSTLFGRRCHTPTINDKNPMLRQFAERQAINAPLQGSNADIIKKAMIKINQSVVSDDIRLLLQVHDELLFEIKHDLVDLIVPKIQQFMQSVVQLKVPLLVEVGKGNNWEEAHS